MALVLLPGLGADARLLEPQRLAFPDLVVPPWIEPRRCESLPDYAARLAETVRPERPLVVGGVSLGGMVAYEMASRLRPDFVVLISSCRSCGEIRPLLRSLRPLAAVLPWHAIELAKLPAPLFSGLLAGVRDPHQRRLCLRMFQSADPKFMRWALKALLDWQPAPLQGIPIFQIHGQRDLLIPAGRVAANHIVPDGGHLINLTHAEVVNAFLARLVSGI